MEGDFELNLIKKNNKFKCHTIIYFNDSSKIDKKEFSNHKKLLKYLKNLIKNSVKYQEVIMFLGEFKLKFAEENKGSE